MSKLGLPFTTCSPDIDETAHPGEEPLQLVRRLSEEKARATATDAPALIIGSDQIAVLDGQIIGKPYDFARAKAQLQRASGRELTFYTGLCLYNSQSDHAQVIVEPFRVHFRTLTDEQIERYLNAEQPYQCAGSFKSEGLGISLFERLEGDDPNSLVGLPLIQLIRLLEKEGIAIP